MIANVLQLPLSKGLFLDYNGHLWTLQYLVYRIQVLELGINSHLFVEIVFLASLLSLELSLSYLLRRARVPLVASLLLAAMATYLNGALQNNIFVVQLASNFCFALCLLATALILGSTASLQRASVVGTLLFASVFCDSGIALAMVIVVAVVMVRSWPRRYWFTVLPAAVVLVLWFSLENLGPSLATTFSYKCVFAGNLLITSLGTLVGGAFLAGCIVAGVVLLLLAYAFWKRLIRGVVATILMAGLVGTLVEVLAISQARASVIGGSLATANRYLGQVALVLVIALAPLVTVVFADVLSRFSLSRGREVVRAVLPAVLIVGAFAFSFNLRHDYQNAFGTSNTIVKTDAQSAAVLLERGCPSGTSLVLGTRPAGAQSPPMITGLIEDLIERGKYTVNPHWRVNRVVRAIVCRPLS